MTITVQSIVGDIPSGQNSVPLSGFTAVASRERAFLLPAISSGGTFGAGPDGDGSNQSRHYFATGDLNAVGEATFQRAGSTSETCAVAAWLLESDKGADDPDGFSVRWRGTIGFVNSALTADGALIESIVDADQVVIFGGARADGSSSTIQMRHGLTTAELVADGSDWRVRARRSGSLSDRQATAVEQAVEFGSAYHVQKVVVNATAGTVNTPIDAVDPTKCLVYARVRGNTDSGNVITFFPEITSATNLRIHFPANNAVVHVEVAIIEHESFTTQYVSDIDDMTAFAEVDSSTAAQVETEEFATPINPARAIVLGWAGTTNSNNSDNPCWLWRVLFGDLNLAQFRRSKSLGTTDYAFAVTEFSAGPQWAEDGSPEPGDATETSVAVKFQVAAATDVTAIGLIPGKAAPSVAQIVAGNDGDNSTADFPADPPEVIEAEANVDEFFVIDDLPTYPDANHHPKYDAYLTLGEDVAAVTGLYVDPPAGHQWAEITSTEAEPGALLLRDGLQVGDVVLAPVVTPEQEYIIELGPAGQVYFPNGEPAVDGSFDHDVYRPGQGYLGVLPFDWTVEAQTKLLRVVWRDDQNNKIATVVDLAGNLQIGLTGLTLLIYYQVPEGGGATADHVLYDQGTDSNGELDLQFEGTLNDGDPLWIIPLKDNGDPLGSARKVEVEEVAA